MKRVRRGILLAGVVSLVGVFVFLMAQPGSLVSAKVASGEPAHREELAALVALLVLGMAALGLDFRDWF